MNGNRFITWLLRSPFHGLLSKGMMLITVTGRKTGKQYTTPVGFFQKHGFYWVLTSRNRTWWKNLQGSANVFLWLQRKSVHAVACPEFDLRTVETLLGEYISYIPQAAKSMGIRVEHGVANREDIARLAKDRLFVRVKPE